MMFYDYMKGLDQEKSLENLNQLFGKNAPSRTKVFFWLSEFRLGRRSLDDEHQCSKPETGVRVKNNEAVKRLIRVEPRITIGKIKKSLSIGMAATMSILHNPLGVRKRYARWLPHSLTDEQ